MDTKSQGLNILENNMRDKVIQFRFRVVNRNVFEAIKSGKKKVETRAATIKFREIKSGDFIKLSCGKENFVKQTKSVKRFKNIKDLLNIYKIETINPKIHSVRELETMWFSFPGYKEKIKKYGLMAFELK